jgi:hypothetical protein
MRTRVILQPPGFRYSDEKRATMQRIDISDFAVALARLVEDMGLVGMFDPIAYSVGQSVHDSAARGGLWQLVGNEPNPPAVTAINGIPAVNFSHGGTRHFTSSYVRAAGSFSVAIVIAVSPTEAEDFPGFLFSTGLQVNTSSNTNVRYQDGTLRFLADNNDTHGVVNTGLGAPGIHVLIFSYDAETDIGAVVRPHGSVVTANFGGYPPAGYVWNLGGFADGSFGSYGFSGKVGHTLFFDQALHAPENITKARSLISLLRSRYAI